MVLLCFMRCEVLAGDCSAPMKIVLDQSALLTQIIQHDQVYYETERFFSAVCEVCLSSQAPAVEEVVGVHEK